MKDQIPDLIPVRRIHNFVYCPRLMYFQLVENIFVNDSNVIEGNMVHRRVDVPSAVQFPPEIDDNSKGTLRSLCLESIDLGIIGTIDLLKRDSEGTWIIYDYKRGAPQKDHAGSISAKEPDIIQLQLYCLLAEKKQLPDFKSNYLLC